MCYMDTSAANTTGVVDLDFFGHYSEARSTR